MTTRMLIDARHPEETRVAVVNGSRVEEFDFEAAEKKQIKGNIYLAKVTRVEPSLQAAFIEYGGNRHGFLAFSEIHPDYYQIPREDRERLLREEQAIEAEEAERGWHDDAGHADDELAPTEQTRDDEDFAAHDDEEDAPAAAAPVSAGEDHPHDDPRQARLRERRMALRRRYKIQDVIKRRQVLLIQVVKEERGNKGAALTTYLSLAGRYCVLMPNTSHGGGISRKISSMADRRRLKTIMDDLALPSGMACIVRTAGLSRSRTEIKRDFDYLTRLWDDIRELTLSSTAPALIHEDSDLIKRSVRDVYGRDIEEILVEGERGYRQAREFMKLLMPTHARRVRQYVDPIPLFQRGQVEGQLNAMFDPVVQLKSGGYIVINQTEALVAIDINSGRSTREHNIEETAYKTNVEAAEEIARQLRLRDLAGLVVIDFIDMENGGNVRRVERAMKAALENDRARIQVGRISSFGLMEMSRQRLRTGVLEASTHTCPMCEGAGVVRSVPSAALAAIRGLEEEAVRGRASILTLRAARDVAVYILNRKRADIVEIEDRYGVRIEVVPDDSLIVPHFGIETAGPPPERADAPALTAPPIILEEEDDDLPYEEEEYEDEPVAADEPRRADAPRRAEGRGDRGGARRDGARPAGEQRAGEQRAGEQRAGKRRRRRGGKGRSGEGAAAPIAAELDVAADAGTYDGAPDWEAGSDVVPTGEGGGRRKRRRGRRGGKGRELAEADAARDAALDAAGGDEVTFLEPIEAEPAAVPHARAVEDEDDRLEDVPPAEEAPKKRRGRPAKAKPVADVGEAADAAEPAGAVRALVATDAAASRVETPDAPLAADALPPKPRRGRKPKAAADGDVPAAVPESAAFVAADPGVAPIAPTKKPRGRKRAVQAEAVDDGGSSAVVERGDLAVALDDGGPAPAGDPGGVFDNDAPEMPPEAAPEEVRPVPTGGAAEDRTSAAAVGGRKGWWQRTFG